MTDALVQLFGLWGVLAKLLPSPKEAVADPCLIVSVLLCNITKSERG